MITSDKYAILYLYSEPIGRFGGETHHKKRRTAIEPPYNAREGRTPIIKNIEVRDKEGHVCSPTYPRRAEGLVKRGRARWIGGNAIELTAPPDETEDWNMSDNMENTMENTAEAVLLEGKDYTTRDLLDTMVAFMKQDDIARQITEAIRAIGENMAKYQGPAEINVDVAPLT